MLVPRHTRHNLHPSRSVANSPCREIPLQNPSETWQTAPEKALNVPVLCKMVHLHLHHRLDLSRKRATHLSPHTLMVLRPEVRDVTALRGVFQGALVAGLRPWRSTS